MGDNQKVFEEENRDIQFDYISGSDIVIDAVRYLERLYQRSPKDILETGIKYLNFQKEDLVILASRPYVGSTSFVLSLSSQLVLHKNISVGFIDPVTKDAIGQRLLSINSGVSLSKIQCGFVNVDDISKIQKAAGQFFDAPFYLYNEPNCNFKAIKKTAISMAMEKHIQLLIVDGFEYIQEIVDSDEKNLRINQAWLLSEFKSIAVELHLPVILVMKLPETRKNTEPILQDFRASMLIPNKADKVLFIHRLGLYSNGNKEDAKLIIAKNSIGPKGCMRLNFLPFSGKFFYDDEEY